MCIMEKTIHKFQEIFAAKHHLIPVVQELFEVCLYKNGALED